LIATSGFNSGNILVKVISTIPVIAEAKLDALKPVTRFIKSIKVTQL
tara:strand:+ start:3578 stop:3718 length:141 start_codon:yes stop_codon:yes gene_type:complete